MDDKKEHFEAPFLIITEKLSQYSYYQT